jgi:hypothetical protein
MYVGIAIDVSMHETKLVMVINAPPPRAVKDKRFRAWRRQ